MPKKDPPTEVWMDAQQYAKLSADEKKAVSAAVQLYETEVAAAEKKMTDTIADVTSGKI